MDRRHSPESTVQGAGDRKRTDWLPLLGLFAVCLAVYWPAIRSQFLLDDYLHASMAEGSYPAPRHATDLYDFVSDADRDALRDRGFFPWWTHPQLTIRFFRPLTSVILWAEHRAFGRHPLPLHLVSFAWWMVAVLAARALYGKLFTPRAVLLGTAVFALAPCHAIPLAWLANSEALVSLVFGTLGLIAYMRWRERWSLWHAALPTVLFTLAMLSGEYAFAFGGYVLAWDLVRRDERWWRRVVGIVPFALPAAIYLIARSRLGYGVTGSGFYQDPLREPLAFLATAPWRVMALLSNVWLTYDAETIVMARERWGVTIVLVAAMLALVLPLKRTLGRLAPEARRNAIWLLLGSTIALVPVLAVAPSARVVGVSALGVAMLVGLVLDDAWFPATPRVERGAGEWAALAATLLGFAHLIHGPGVGWLAMRRLRDTANVFAASVTALNDSVGDLSTRTVNVIRGGGAAFFAPFAVQSHGSLPGRWRVLALTGHVLVLRREANTIDLVASREQGVFMADQSNLFRSPKSRMYAGDTVDTGGIHVTVIEANEHGPSVVRFEFDQDLDSPDFVWLVEDMAGFHVIQLPAVGFGMPFDP